MHGHRGIAGQLVGMVLDGGDRQVDGAGHVAVHPLVFVARVDHGGGLGGEDPGRQVLDLSGFEAAQLATAGCPGVNPAIEVPEHGVIADPEKLTMGVGELLL